MKIDFCFQNISRNAAPIGMGHGAIARLGKETFKIFYELVQNVLTTFVFHISQVNEQYLLILVGALSQIDTATCMLAPPRTC
jgi:hypothetical protein